jgi:hypothetical protein
MDLVEWGPVPMELEIPLSFLTNLLLVGFLISASVFPGIRVTGRLSTDPLNQLDSTEVTLATGGAVTLATGGAVSDSSRWGDYSAMAVNPIDDYAFW